jgi:hypothetical protein
MTDVQPIDTIANSEVERFLTSVEAAVMDDPAAISAAIVANILQARTAEDVFGTNDVTPAEDVLGQRLTIRGVRWNRSRYDDGPTVYAMIDAVDDDGEVLTISCSGRNVMAQLFRLNELGAFPAVCAIVQADRPTAAGYFVLNLVARAAR